MGAFWQLAERVVQYLFWYCCDFMINLANRAHTSYDEANTWVLLLVVPGLLAGLVGLRLVQLWALRRGKR